jgi:hypothetical protein
MIYVVNNIKNQKYFINKESNIDKYALEIIGVIRDRESDQFVDISFGYCNVHITAVGTKFDVWLYNSKHPVFQQALVDANENGYNLLVIS